MSSALPAKGYAYVVDPVKGVVERDTFTCNHHNGIIIVHKGQVNQAPMCLRCMKPICKQCAHIAHVTGRCEPFDKKIEEYEAGRRSSLA